MLAPGGLFLQYDGNAYGGFGDCKAMKSYMKKANLGLKLVKMTIPISYDDLDTHEGGDGCMCLIQWRKSMS